MTRRTNARRPVALVALVVGGLALSSCGLFDRDPPPEPSRPGADVVGKYAKARRARPNVHAWQAARETLTFLDLRTEDPFGGVLATDWYRPKSSPNERLRVTLAIVSPELTRETIKVSVIKQRQTNGRWQDVPVSARTVSAIHDRIYKRAVQRQAESR